MENQKTKILWFDVETTGLDPVIHDVHQLAMLVDINGKIVDELEMKIKPRNWDNIEQKALDVSGVTVEQLKTYDPPKQAYFQICNFLEKYVNKYDKSDKLIPGAYNGHFDLNFLSNFFKKCDDKYLGSYINWKLIDPLAFMRMYDLMWEKPRKNYKLEFLCKSLDIKLKDAHDALADIKATRNMYYKIKKKITKK